MKITRAIVGVCLLSACASCAGGVVGAGTKIDVVAQEYSFDPNPITTTAHTIALAIHNQGELEHEFRLFSVALQLAAAEHISPGLTRGIGVDVKPGTYTFECRIADHAQRGMRGVLTVS